MTIRILAKREFCCSMECEVSGERLFVGKGDCGEMGHLSSLGEPVIREGRIPGCERLGTVWAVPEVP